MNLQTLNELLKELSNKRIECKIISENCCHFNMKTNHTVLDTNYAVFIRVSDFTKKMNLKKIEDISSKGWRFTRTDGKVYITKN